MQKVFLHKGEFDTCLFIWITDVKAGIQLSTTCEKNRATIFNVNDDEVSINIDYNKKKYFIACGIYCIKLAQGEEAYLTLEYDTGIYPFILNGPGILPKIRETSSLWFTEDVKSIYIAVPKVTKNFSLSYNAKKVGNVQVYDTAKKQQHAIWEPVLENGSFIWHVNDFYSENNAGYWTVKFAELGGDFKVNEGNGLAIFLEKPLIEFPYHFFCIQEEQGLDYRVTVKRNGHIDAVFDVLYYENEIYPVIPGRVEFVFSAGFCYREKSVHMVTQKENCLNVSFTKILHIPSGWLRGDLHVHSCYEDACSTPQRITKAGRCNGLDFMFLTDHGGKKIIDNGLLTWKEDNRFLPLPGQECVNQRTHMNFLNVPFDIDYRDKTEAEWISDANKKNPSGNDYIKMLNHPSHLPKATKGWWCTHFRSWWVATEHKDIELVENFDFITWFDHLTRGRQLTGIWTTDTHDGTVERPGNGCSFVYTDGDFSDKAIIKALKEGRVTNSFLLGAFLNITIGGKMIGDIVNKKAGKIKISIEGYANVQIDRVELVANGIVAKTWSGNDSLEFIAEYDLDIDLIPIKSNKSWAIAIMYYKNHEYTSTQHSQWIDTNVAAFTNPIYIVR